MNTFNTFMAFLLNIIFEHAGLRACSRVLAKETLGFKTIYITSAIFIVNAVLFPGRNFFENRR